MQFASSARRYLPALLVNLVFFGSALWWIFLIPYNRAPDENNHFHYSVRFIMENRRLPVTGVDDVECFRNAASSYNTFPAVNYVMAALAAGVLRRLAGLDPYLGARMASLCFGLVFVNGLLLAGRRLGRRHAPAALAAAVAAWIPQVVFTAAYVNADSYALAATGVLAWGVARILPSCTPADAARGPHAGDIWIFGLGIALLLTAKLNFWVYLLWIGLAGLGCLATGCMTWRTVGRMVLAAAVLSALIALGWYARNFMLYGHPLPLTRTPEWLAGIGVARPPARLVIAEKITPAAVMELVRRGFFTDTLSYFYARFGYGDLGFDPRVYAVLKFAAPAAAAWFIAAALTARDRALNWGLAWLTGLCLTNLWMLLFYAVTYDYQPQGRYLFPVLAPAVLWMAAALGRHPRLLPHALPLLSVNVWLLMLSHRLLMTAY